MYRFFSRAQAETPPPTERMSDLERLAQEDPWVRQGFLVGQLLDTAPPHIISMFAWCLCTNFAFPDDPCEAANITIYGGSGSISLSERALPECACYRR